MKNQTKKTSKIALLTALIVVIAFAVAVIGTYTWSDYSQHKSNDFRAGNLDDYDVTLIDEFETVENWTVEDGKIPKKIRVKNTGQEVIPPFSSGPATSGSSPTSGGSGGTSSEGPTSGGTSSEGPTSGGGTSSVLVSSGYGKAAYSAKPGDIYVRLRLKEYMEVSEKIEDKYSQKRYMIDADGEFIRFDTDTYVTKADALVELKKYAKDNFQNIYTFEETDLEKAKGYYDDKEYWYVVTKGGDANGQYGKFLLIESGYKAPVPIVDGAERSHDANDDHQKIPNGECDYAVHYWHGIRYNGELQEVVENCTHGFHEFVEWFLGDNVADITEWDGWDSDTPQKKWFLDTDSGYAYWGAPLAPNEETTNLLEFVSLKKQPGGPFYYTIHVEMEAVSAEEIDVIKPAEKVQSVKPSIDPVTTTSNWITGRGVSGASIRVVMHNGSEQEAEVDGEGNWRIAASGMQDGEIIRAYQTEPGKLESEAAVTMVSGS